MPSIYQLKPAFQNLLRPMVRGLYHRGVTANQVTVLAMFISVFLAAYLGYVFHSSPAASAWYFLSIPVWMLIRMAFNAIDGMLAREFQQQSKLGAYLNELCDVISDTALYLCFIVLSFISTPLVLLTIFLAIVSEYAGVMAPLIGQERRYDGPMGKSDRAFWFSLLAILFVASPYCADFVTEQHLTYIGNSLLTFIILLLLVTIYNRIHHAIQNTTN